LTKNAELYFSADDFLIYALAADGCMG